MKCTTVFATLATVVLGVHALPHNLARRDDSTESAVNAVSPDLLVIAALDLANSFYENIKNFDETSFEAAGFSEDVWNVYKGIAETEQQRRDSTIKALGLNDSPPPYNYDFGVLNARSFVKTSVQVQIAIVTAYDSAVLASPAASDFSHIVSELFQQEKKFANSILRPLYDISWSGDWLRSLSPEEALTLTAPFVSSTSPSFPSPFGSFLPLTVSPGSGPNSVTLQFDHASGDEASALFVTDGGKESSPVNDGQAKIPSQIDTAVVLVAIGTTSQVTTAFASIVVQAGSEA